jgi:hypothetical protein
MGADLLLARLPFKMSLKDIEKGEWKKILVKKIIKSDLKADEYVAIADMFGLDYETEKQEIRKRIIEAINEFSIGRRDVSYYIQDEIINVISGGMSWGDSPTEMYDYISILSELPEAILKSAGILFNTERPAEDKKFLSQDKKFEKMIVSYFQAQGWQEQDMLLQKINKVLVNKLWSKK